MRRNFLAAGQELRWGGSADFEHFNPEGGKPSSGRRNQNRIPAQPVWLGTEAQQRKRALVFKKIGASEQLAPTWWRRVDSNHRSETQQIYSLPPLATREFSHYSFLYGAGGRTRTPDLLITNQLLYQLSYTSMFFDA